MVTFRSFSHAVYSAPGVAEECLEMQDRHGVDVNILLFCAFASVVRKVALSADDIADIERHVAGLREGVIAPLRYCRRALKQGIAALDSSQRNAAEDLRTQVKEIELAAEHFEQDLLVGWLAKSRHSARADVRVAPRMNIEVLLSFHGSGAPYPEKLDHAARSFA